MILRKSLKADEAISVVVMRHDCPENPRDNLS
jgi:hypothetical protein